MIKYKITIKNILELVVITFLLVGCSIDNIENEVFQAQKPVAVADFYSTDKNSALEITNFLANDTIQSSTVISAFDAVTSKDGRITKNSDASYTYTPKTNFTGSDTFTYTICNNTTTKDCSTATVTITVKPSPLSNTGSFTIPVEVSSYYTGIDFSLTGNSLKDVLATKTIKKHTTFLEYTPDVWNVLKQADLDTTDTTKVLLIYGYNDTDSSKINDKTRNKEDNGGNSGDWNREHIYPKSLGTPNLGTSGPGSDAHHLRASDVDFNSQRGNKKFATGSGNAGDSSGGWYPGDTWKGDVARMLMYMYLRYGNQCLPKNATIGSSASSDTNMITLLLEWNAQDPVSEIEKQRNTVISKAQGNRNPFIDNPYLATLIWGENKAENRWK